MHVKYLFLISSALAVSTPAFAQEAATGDSAWGGGCCQLAATRLPIIVVTATRTETPLSEVGQSVSVVTREQIERTQSVTATDVLQRLPGVSVARSGGFGQPASVFIRGADNSQSLVLIDGVRINDPADVGGGFDFGSLTIGQFDRVEVVRGSQSVLWGSRAIGGVINLITAAPTDQWRVSAQGEYGWRDQKQLGASAAGKLGPVGISAGANWLKGDGYSAYDERLGATEKDGFESKSANLRAVIDIAGGLSADAGGFWTKAEYDYDGFARDALNLGEKRDVTGFANLRYSGLDGRLSARFGYGMTDTRRVSDDAVFGPYITNGRNERIEGQVAFTPVDLVSVLVGAEHEKSKFRDNFGSRDTTDIDSAFATLTLRPVTGLTLAGGVRHDDHRDFGKATTFSANGAWAIGGEEAPVLRASYGEGFKAPSLYQLYTNSGFTALDPETSKGWDAGIEQPFAEGTGKFTVTYFDRKTKNLIDYDFATFTYYNIGRTRARGLELGMQVTDWQGFDVSLSYTYLDAENRLTGNQLARRPKNNFYGSIDYAWPFGLRTGIDLAHGGQRFDNQANTVLVGEHTLVGLRASVDVADRFEVYGRVENVLDETYQVVSTYGTPGRAAYVGVRVRM
jgi:vitamin B12 transporter